MINILKKISNELKEWHQVVTTNRPGDIAHEIITKFYEEWEE